MAESEKEAILQLSQVAINYGTVPALFKVNIRVNRGEIVVLLGPNGAGKSTLLNAIVGILSVTKGEIRFNGRVINGLPTEQLVKMGMTLIPEGRLLFAGMSTLENLEVGAYSRQSRERREGIKQSLSGIFRLFPSIKKRESQQAGLLSGGEQQMLAVGRGLMSQPQLLLLDEPSLGLAPMLVRELMNTLARLRKEQGLTILLAEQNAIAALAIADRGYVMETGKVVIEGSSTELRSTEKIRAVYLGE
jgi:branched-chain amino acid transport system ATP-binding protein